MTICAGCGFSLDEAGNFGITGVTNRDWTYTAAGHTNPDGWYCDTGTDGVTRLWHQPWNLPWGKVAGATGSGVGAYANGIGVQNVCAITVTFKTNRVYMIQGTFFYNADVRTVFDVANPFFGAQAGGCIYNVTNSAVVMSQTAVSTGLNFAGTVTLNYYFENNTGADITKTYAWRSLALGLINARPASSPFTGLVCHDLGPRVLQMFATMMAASAGTPTLQWWESGGSRIVWFAAVITALGFLSRTKPVRWLWTTVVTEPLSRWQTSVIAAVVDEKVVKPNGGSSLRDAVDALAEHQVGLADQQATLLSWTAEQAERQSEWAEYVGSEFAQVNNALEMLCDEVGKLKQRKGVA